MDSYLKPNKAQIAIAQENPLIRWMIPHLVGLTDYAVMGSVVLCFYGIRRPTDVDILVSPAEWNVLLNRPRFEVFEPLSGAGSGIALEELGKRVELFSHWPHLDSQHVLQESFPVETKYGTVKIAPLEIVYAYKMHAAPLEGGAKHLADCARISLYYDTVGLTLPVV